MTKILCKLEPASYKYRNKHKSKHWDIMPDKQTQTQAPGHNAAPDGGKLRPAGKWGTSHHLSFPTTVNLFVALLLLVASFLFAFFRIEIYEVSCCTKGWVWSRHWIADVLIPNNSCRSSSGGWRKSSSSGSTSNIGSKLSSSSRSQISNGSSICSSYRRCIGG